MLSKHGYLTYEETFANLKSSGRATELVSKLRHQLYESQLENHSMANLKKEFRMGDQIETFKIIKGIEM